MTFRGRSRVQTIDAERLNDLIRLGIETAGIKDFDVLMERMLGAARRFARCDAGSVYIRRGDVLEFGFAQNDTLAARLEPGKKLVYRFFTVPVDNRSLAGYSASTGRMLNIPDAYDLPDGVPYHIDRSFDAISGYRTRSILTVPLATHRGETIGVLQLINAKDDNGGIVPFDTAIEPYVAYFAANAAAALERAHLMRTVILRMIGMAELRDPRETGSHVNRVAGFAVEMYETWARKKGVTEADIDRTRDVLRMAAMLHDVGKVAISDVILKKPARLNPAEYETMKGHTVAGARLFGNMTSEFDEAAREVALNHHERWDGAGYPGHVDAETGEALPGHADAGGKPIPKKGDEIPLFGRIVAIADVYDALSSARSYKEAWTEERVMDEIRAQKGGAFDPEIVDAFFECLPALRALAERYR